MSDTLPAAEFHGRRDPIGRAFDASEGRGRIAATVISLSCIPVPEVLTFMSPVNMVGAWLIGRGARRIG